MHNFVLTWLENLHHFSILRKNFWFNKIWHRQYVIIFGLTWLQHRPRQNLSCVGGWQKVTSLSCHQPCVRTDYNGNIITQIILLLFLLLLLLILQLSFHSVAVVLTPVQTKQIIHINKTKQNKKHSKYKYTSCQNIHT